MATIASVAVRLFQKPLAEVLVDAKPGAHTHFEMKTANAGRLSGFGNSGWPNFHFLLIELCIKRLLETRNSAARETDIGATFDWARLAAGALPPDKCWGTA